MYNVKTVFDVTFRCLTVNKIIFAVDRGEREVGGRKTGKGQRAG